MTARKTASEEKASNVKHRGRPRLYDSPRHPYMLRISEELWQAIQDKARSMQVPINSYLTMLISNDLGLGTEYAPLPWVNEDDSM